MVRLLVEGVTKNKDLEFLGIVDRAPPEQWEGRIASLFAPSFRTANFKYVEMKAEEFYRKFHGITLESPRDKNPFADPIGYCESLRA